MRKISKKTISRLLLYHRTLEQMNQDNAGFVSSGRLAEITGLTDVQIRKDISIFGKVGRPRIGYRITRLKRCLKEFVLQNTVHVALFGVGNLGSAIAKYPGFQNERIKLVAAFEKDKRKIGKQINGIRIYPLKDAPRIIPRSHAEIGIIAVTMESAQQVADIMSRSGLKGIVNFSPVPVRVPTGVSIKDIDLSIEFLSFFCDIKKS